MSTPPAHRSSSAAARASPPEADAPRSIALRSPAPPARARAYSVTDNSLYTPTDLGLAATRDVTLSWRTSNCAEVAELADAGDSKSPGLTPLGVRFPSSARMIPRG